MDHNPLLNIPSLTKTRRQGGTIKTCDLCYKKFKPFELRWCWSRWSNTLGKNWFNYHQTCYRIMLKESIRTLQEKYDKNLIDKNIKKYNNPRKL